MTSTHSTLHRKVTASGVVWIHGRSYYVSRRLAGQVIPVTVIDGRLVIDVLVPLRKVYRLPKREPTGAVSSTESARMPAPFLRPVTTPRAAGQPEESRERTVIGAGR